MVSVTVTTETLTFQIMLLSQKLKSMFIFTIKGIELPKMQIVPLPHRYVVQNICMFCKFAQYAILCSTDHKDILKNNTGPNDFNCIKERKKERKIQNTFFCISQKKINHTGLE